MPRKRPTDANQPSFDFPRISQVRILENVELPEPPAGSGVSRTACKAVLAAIDSFCGTRARWRTSKESLAERAHVSVKTLKRALTLLEEWSLVIIERDKSGGWKQSRYGICWSNLRDLDRRRPPEDQESGVGSQESEEPYLAEVVEPDEEPYLAEVVDAPSNPQSATRNPQSIPPLERWVTAAEALGHGDPTEGSRCPERRVTLTQPKGHGDPSKGQRDPSHYLYSPQELPPRTPPTSTQSGNRKAESGGWEAVEAEVARELGDWREALEACRERVEPEYVLAVIAHYRRAGPGVWGAGALHFRLKSANPATAPTDGWPPMRDPPAEVRRALAALADCRGYCRQRGIPTGGEKFWAGFARHLAKHGLEHTLDEVRFRATADATSPREVTGGKPASGW